MYKCGKCGWEGKKPATMGAAGLKLKVCQNCLSRSIEKVTARPQAIGTNESA